MRYEQVDHDPFGPELKPVDFNPFAREVYVIRHGATALNSESGGTDRIRGWKNVPLSEEGREQAEKLAQKLANSGIQVLYHSTLSRAVDTAKAIARTTGAKLVACPNLRPWNVGKLTGQDSNVASPQLRDYAENKPSEPIPGGESFDEFKRRAFGGIKQALDDTDGQLLGIVTHHRVERLIQSWIKGGEQPDLSLDLPEMFKHGESTGTAELVEINPEALSEVGEYIKPIDRSAFLYLPASRGDKQCGTCASLTTNGLCAPIGIPVDRGWSCGLYVPGQYAGEIPAQRVTPEEAGLVMMQVRCENCVYGGNECGLYQKLNETLNSKFRLDTKIEPRACCNAFTPKEEPNQ